VFLQDVLQLGKLIILRVFVSSLQWHSVWLLSHAGRAKLKLEVTYRIEDLFMLQLAIGTSQLPAAATTACTTASNT